jgi:hypothetical protein
MVAHKAEGVDAMSEPLDPLLEQEVKSSPVPVIEEDGLPCVAAQGDMIERPWIVDSWLTSHGPILNNNLLNCRPGPRCFSRCFSRLLCIFFFPAISNTESRLSFSVRVVSVIREPPLKAR